MLLLYFLQVPLDVNSFPRRGQRHFSWWSLPSHLLCSCDRGSMARTTLEVWIIQYLPLSSTDQFHSISVLCNGQSVQTGHIPSALEPFPDLHPKKSSEVKQLTETAFFLVGRWQNLAIIMYTFRLQILLWVLYEADSLERNDVSNSKFLLQWCYLWGQEWDSQENRCIPYLLLKMSPLIFHNVLPSSAGNCNSYHS